MTTKELTAQQVHVLAAWHALQRARHDAYRCPSADNLAAEETAEQNLDTYLDRLPREALT